MDLGEVEGELQRALNGLSASRTASVAALEKAQAIQNHAAQTGFRRVAEQIDQVREALLQSLAVQTAVVSSVESTMVSVHGVTADPTPSEIVAALHAAEERISSGAATVGRLVTNTESLKSQTAAALHGGQPGPLLGLLSTMQQALKDVVSTLVASKSHTDEATTRARGLGSMEASSSPPNTREPEGTHVSVSEPPHSDKARVMELFIKIGEKSKQGSHTRLVENQEELGAAYRELSAGGTPVDHSTYDGEEVLFPDGTTVGLRSGSKSGGPTIDIKIVNVRKNRKVHLRAWTRT